MTIGEQMRRARHAKRLTVKELSAVSGVSQRAITAYEAGTRDLYKASFETVASLADWLGIGLDDLAYMATHERGCDRAREQTLFED